MFALHQLQATTAPTRLKAISKRWHKAVVKKYRQERRFSKMLRKCWELNGETLLYFFFSREKSQPHGGGPSQRLALLPRQDHSSLAIPCCEPAVAMHVIMTWLGTAWLTEPSPRQNPTSLMGADCQKQWVVLWAPQLESHMLYVAKHILAPQPCTAVCSKLTMLEVKRYNELFLVPIHTNVAPIKLQYQHLTKSSHPLENTNIWATVKAEK